MVALGLRKLVAAVALVAVAVSLQGCFEAAIQSAQDSVASLVCSQEVSKTVRAIQEKSAELLHEACVKAVAGAQATGVTGAIKIDATNTCMEGGSTQLSEAANDAKAELLANCTKEIGAKLDKAKSSAVDLWTFAKTEITSFIQRHQGQIDSFTSRAKELASEAASKAKTVVTDLVDKAANATSHNATLRLYAADASVELPQRLAGGQWPAWAWAAGMAGCMAVVGGLTVAIRRRTPSSDLKQGWDVSTDDEQPHGACE